MSDKDEEDQKEKKRGKDKKGSKERSKSKDKERKKEKLERGIYELPLDDKIFSLRVEVDKKLLKFVAHETGELYRHVYKNKYELNQVVKKLNLVQAKYTSFSKLIKFIDTAYSFNKIYLEQNSDDDLYVWFEVPVDF